MNLFLALLVPVGATSEPSGTGIDQIWADKARSDLLPMIDRRVQLSTHLSEISEFSSAALPGSKAQAGAPVFHEKTALNEVSRRDRDLLFKSVTNSSNKNEDVTNIICRNEYYNFKLTKKGSDGKYVLVSHSNEPPQGDWAVMYCGHLAMVEPMRRLLSAIESKDGYAVRRLSWDAEKSIVIAEFFNKHEDPQRVFDFKCSFNPALGWAPVESVMKSWAGLTVVHFEYGFEIEGLSFPKLVESKTSFHVSPAPPDHLIRQEIRTLERSHATERDYRLTAFGLPEPVDAPPLPRSGLPTYMYILIGALTCGGLSLVFRYLARRSRK